MKKNAHKNHIRKELIFFIMLALVAGSFPLPVYADSVYVTAGAAAAMDPVNDDAEDEAQNYTIPEELPKGMITVEIDSPSDLIDLAKNATMDSYTKGKCFVLTRDINMIGSYRFDTIPIFSGYFDGRGHTISGVTYGGDGYVTGLFRYIDEGAGVFDLNVSGDIGYPEGKMEATGGIAGINHGLISNCTFNGTITGHSSTGGIAGINEAAGSIKGCTNYAHLMGYYYTGGIAGKNYGNVSYSYNKGAINDNIKWAEGSDEQDPKGEYMDELMERGIDKTMLKSDNDIRLHAGIDTGGISGYSRGGIFQCKNTGIIGYDHVGYNVGGIAGRQSGIVSFCSNEGEVLGRKDVGGIVGQMEPNLSLSDLETLPDAVDRLHDLVNVTITDLNASTSEISTDVNALSEYADNAFSAGNDLGRSAEDYLNRTSDSLNNTMSKVEYLSDQVPEIMRSFSRAGTQINDMSKSIHTLVDDANVYSQISASANDAAKIREDLDSISRNTASMNAEIREAVHSDDPIEIVEKLADAMSAASDVSVSVNNVTQTVRPYIRSSLKSISGNSTKVTDNMKQAADSLKEGMDKTHGVFDHINAMEDINIPHLGGDFDVAREGLADNLSAMAKTLSLISSHRMDSSHQLTEDMAAVNDQINSVFHLISDELEMISDISLDKDHDDLISDISNDDIDAIISGKVEHSENIGNISGDINIGGITGSMDIDSDDPEENAAGDMTGGFSAKYLLRNAVIDCKNDAKIRAKMQGSGGIAGYMAHGVVSDCESYGYITSDEGDYIGGISGRSDSIIKDSYSMVFLNGNSYVGGIAGYGTTIKGCTSFPTFDKHGSKYGSIAGQIETDKDTQEQHLEVISGNRFICDKPAGIDGRSFAGKAEPVTYDKVMSEDETPEKFGKIPVLFHVGDIYVRQTEMPYGTSMSKLDYPQIPPMNGYYVEWIKADENSELVAPTMINGTPHIVEKTLKSVDTYPGTDESLVLISGNFIKDDTLNVRLTDKGGVLEYEVSLQTEHPANIEAVRFYDPNGGSKVYGVSDGGVEHRLEGSVKGSYIEVKTGLTYNIYRLKDPNVIKRIKSLF